MSALQVAKLCERESCGMTDSTEIAGGCQHEHVKAATVCSYHRSVYMTKGAYCIECRAADGHLCAVTFRVLTVQP